MEKENKQERTGRTLNHKNNSPLSDFENELDITIKKQKVANEKHIKDLDELLLMLTNTKEQLQTTSKNDTDKVKEIMKNASETTKKSSLTQDFLSSQKNSTAQILKLSKQINKFTFEDATLLQGDHLFDSFEELSHVILEHLYSSGRYEVGQKFQNQSAVTSMDPHFTEEFKELFYLLKELREKRSTSRVLQWVEQNREALHRIGDDIEYQLVKVSYLELIFEKKDQQLALDYAKKHFSRFSQKHMAEIQKLMGCLLYVKNPTNSPCKALYSPEIYFELSQDFASSYCRLKSLPDQSPLSQIITAGTLALPKQLKFQAILRAKFKLESVETDLPNSFHHHPVFVCPVSKEETNGANPPVLLSCGHVISKNSAQKLGSHFKCPYCPETQCLASIIELKF